MTFDEILEIIPLLKGKYRVRTNAGDCAPLLYVGVAESRLVDEIEQLASRFFGPPYKAAGESAVFKNVFDGFVKSVGGVRREQSLYRAVISPSVSMYCAFWPWGSNPVKTSVRIGLVCHSDEERLMLEKSLKGRFR